MAAASGAIADAAWGVAALWRPAIGRKGQAAAPNMSRSRISSEERDRLRQLVREQLAVEPPAEMDASFRRQLAMARYEQEHRSPALRRRERVEALLARWLPQPAPALIAAALLLGIALVWLDPFPGKLEAPVAKRAWTAGAVVELAAGESPLALRFGQAYALLLEPGSRLEIAALPGRRRPGENRFALRHGGLTVTTRPRFAGSGLRVDLANSSVRVTGTKFQVRQPEVGAAAEVWVDEGTVEITAGQAAAAPLSAGQYARVTADGALETGTMEPLRRRQLRAALATLAIQTGGVRRVPEIELNIGEHPARVLELLVPCDLVYDSRAKGPVVLLLNDARRHIEEAANGDDPAAPGRALAALWQIVEEHADPRINTALLLYLAAYAHDVGEKAQALAALDRIIDAEPEGPLLSLAYAAKALILERDRQPAAGLAVWRELVRLYPRSLEAVFAQVRLGTP